MVPMTELNFLEEQLTLSTLLLQAPMMTLLTGRMVILVKFSTLLFTKMITRQTQTVESKLTT
ncbi:MAG: hypothetical protein CBC62_10720 [Opitutia bacterium TMED102]|nr:hypothetical protein [Verrucomicrobiales bacterium]OUV34870.1 MAG: hypothetical protein CBC62_10720 [Opitutae bacterium TMED102]